MIGKTFLSDMLEGRDKISSLRHVLKEAAYTDIAWELEAHAGEELEHAIETAKQIDYLGGMPAVQIKPSKTANDSVEMLRADLENEQETVGRYRERIQQAETMGEFALSETLRAIIVKEQEHEIDLISALNINVRSQKSRQPRKGLVPHDGH